MRIEAVMLTHFALSSSPLSLCITKLEGTSPIIMDPDHRPTFSTQRFDPMLKRQQSSTWASGHTPAPIIRSLNSLVSPGQSQLTIKEPSINNHRLSRVLSLVSSNPSASRWHEGHSTGVSTMATTEFSHDLLSRSTSATSFNLSTGERSMSVDERRCGDAPGTEQSLIQSLVSAEQVDAHVPPSAALGSRFSEWSENEDEDDSIGGQVRLVTSTRVAEADEVPVPTIRPRSTSEPLPLSRHFHQVHSEDDLDYDADTDTVGGILISSPRFAGDEAEDDVCLDFRNARVSDIPIPSPTLFPRSTPLAPTSLISVPSSFQLRSPTPIARDVVISDVYEEHSPAIEFACRRQAFSTPNFPGSSLLMNSTSHREDTTVASPPSPTVDCYAWCRLLPKHRYTGQGGSRSEHSNRVNGETMAQAEKETTASRTQDCRVGLKTLPDNCPQVHEERRLPLPPLQSVCGCIPRNTARQMRSKTKSGARLVLSVILPCIPVAVGETRRDEEKNRGRMQQEGARATEATITTSGRNLTKQGEEGHRKSVVKKKSSAALLEVRVDRQIDRVVDYRSS